MGNSRSDRRRRGLPRWAILAALVLVVACQQAGPRTAPGAPAVTHRQLTVDGRARTYRVFDPTGETARPSPLVLVLHGFGNTGESMVQSTQFDREAAASGFIVAYPEGVGGTWNAGFCCGTASAEGVDDLGFLRAVLDQVEADHRVDPAAVYVAGVSNGAIMGYRLACQTAERIAAVGSVAGTMPLEGCDPSRPVSVIEIHGTDDPLVPYQGGSLPHGSLATQPAPPTPAVAQRWAQLNGCASQATSRTDGPVATATWPDCRAGTTVRLVTIEGAGHTWFAPGFGPAEGAVDATGLLWDFFSDHRRGADHGGA